MEFEGQNLSFRMYFFPSKNVPHILEKIFLDLEDYDSFMACQDVCKAWRGLFSSELFKKRARDLLYEKMGWKKDSRPVAVGPPPALRAPYWSDPW